MKYALLTLCLLLSACDHQTAQDEKGNLPPGYGVVKISGDGPDYWAWTFPSHNPNFPAFLVEDGWITKEKAIKLAWEHYQWEQTNCCCK